MKNHIKTTILILGLGVSFLATGCEEKDPDTNLNNVKENNGNNITGAQVDCEMVCLELAKCDNVDEMCGSDFTSTCKTACSNTDALGGLLPNFTCDEMANYLDGAAGLETTCAQINTCMPAASDYVAGQDDMWAACISDDNTYHKFEDSISSAGRVAGFEQIADILWRAKTIPSGMDFLKAREIYAAGEGLDSRVQRREDEHYAPVSDGMGGTLSCRDEGVPEKDTNRCVGPAQIRPIINAAFEAGIKGEDALVNAAKIEAALLWFMYVSTHKEATTCTAKKKDCDSSYAYYTGAQPREAGIGLAKYLRTQVPQAHDRVWDGLLAVRCWRDLDTEEVAMDTDLRDRAISQLDEALLYGLSQLIAQRAAASLIHKDELRAADDAWLAVMTPILYRDLENKRPTTATALKAAIKDKDNASIVRALSASYDCP